jgi:hypothetical protein
MKLITGTEVKTKVGGGIYYVQCLKNNRRYIGSSTNIYSRWFGYSKGEIENKSLLKDVVTYGIDNFEMGVLESIEIGNLSREDYSKLLYERESFFIKLLKTTTEEFGYNKTDNTTNSTRNVTPKFVYCKNLITKEVIVYDSISKCGQYIFEYAESKSKGTALKICKDRVSEIANQSRGYKNIYSFKDHTFSLSLEGIKEMEQKITTGQKQRPVKIVELDMVFDSIKKAAEHISSIIGRKVDNSNIRKGLNAGKSTFYGYTILES